MYQGHLEKVLCLFEGVLCTKECNVGHYWHQSDKFYFESSQIATVTKSKNTWKSQMSMWRCFLYLAVNHRALLTSIWEVVFWIVTNCDSHKRRQIGILAVAFSDLSHFGSWPFCRSLIMAVTAQTESNNTENVFWVLQRVPMFTFDMNMKTYIFAHSGVI